MSNMTMKQRMVAVLQGTEHDRVPFVQYNNVAAPYVDIWAELGQDNLGLLKWMYIHDLVSDDCRIETQEISRGDLKGFRSTLHTPVGSLSEEKFLEPTYGTGSISKHYVKDPDDYRILLAYLRSVKVRKNVTKLNEAIAEYGNHGLPHISMGRSPYQQLWVEWVCIEDLAGHMADYPDLLAETVDALRSIQKRIFELGCEVVKDYPNDVFHINVGDNITAPMIGQRLFREYCLPQYNLLAEMLDGTGRDIPVFVHMDGDLKPLWPAISESRVRGLDSFSPPPDNDTSVADAVRLWPQMRLWLNFPSSVHLAPPKEVYRVAMQILQEGGHTGRLQIQISENVPPGVWRSSFPQIVKAIHDFGKP